MLERTLIRLASRAGGNARLSTLIFHRVLVAPDALFPEEPDAQAFDRLCSWLKRWFVVLPLAEAVQLLRARQLPSRALSITFDDGYADNLTVAQPILARHGLPATVFVAPGYLDGGRMWNDTVIESVRRTASPSLDLSHLDVGLDGKVHLPDAQARRRVALKIIGHIKHLPPEQRLEMANHIARRAACDLPDDLMMTTQQLKTLSGLGIDIGAHTMTHPILAGLDDKAAGSEIECSKVWLSEKLGREVSCFAYPNGKPGSDYLPRDVALVREVGFDFAVSTARGAASLHSDFFQLPRFTPWDRTPARFAMRMIDNLMRAPAPVLMETA